MNKVFSIIRFGKIPRNIAGVMVMSVAALLVTACGGDQAQAAIKATWITPQVSGTTLTFPASEIEKNTLVHFRIPTASGTQAFMAYKLEGKTHVRANVCPPCRSIGFSLQGDILVCDTCATLFDAKTGDGISGPCVPFPKADVPYQVNNGNMVMSVDDLNTAYKNTEIAGRP